MIDKIQHIKQLVQQQLKLLQLSEKENALLKKEIEKQNFILTEQTKHIEQLKQKIDGLKMKGSTLLPEEKREMLKRVDGYLKEIDVCLDILSKE